MIDQVGVKKKYQVKRLDGKDCRGGKHENCAYYVLDLNHDRYAVAALEAYANACRLDYPELAGDIDEWVDFMRTGQDKPDWVVR